MPSIMATILDLYCCWRQIRWFLFCESGFDIGIKGIGAIVQGVKQGLSDVLDYITPLTLTK